MKLRVVLLTAMLLSLVLGVNNAAVKPAAMPVRTAMPAMTPAQVMAKGTDAITIPGLLSYQGKLLDAGGNPVIDTTYSVLFSLYTVSSGGSAFWSETQTVRTKAGLFSVLLGSVTPIESLPQAGTCYLGMKVGADPEMTPRLQIASAAYAFLAHKADTANYALASAAVKTWVRVGSDSVLFTVRQLGIARGGSSDSLYGNMAQTQVNLGVSSSTGTSGQNQGYCAVGGGDSNTASGAYATVTGGEGNAASGQYAFVGGGQQDIADSEYATVGGGCCDTAGGIYATVGGGNDNAAGGAWATVAGGASNVADSECAFVGGGYYNWAYNYCATVGGGNYNGAGGNYATVGGGYENIADSEYATVGGGDYNRAGGDFATVGGGVANVASGSHATVGGGSGDTASANNSFAVGGHSVVPGSYTNSSAFNGQTATASNQLCCGVLSKTGGSFTIDDPIDPQNKLLNHYFVESPNMSNLYSGSVVLDANGRAEVRLPDYFDALNRNPRVQLTGVGTYEVFVAEKESNNRFVVGGKPGAEIYWQVTGDRKDQSAEIIRTMMPVEQPKTGALAGRSWDDNFLAGCMQQLEAMGKAGEFSFRTAAGRQRYEDMLKQLHEAEQQKPQR